MKIHWLLLSLSLVSCGNSLSKSEFIKGIDLHPPVLEQVLLEDQRTMTVFFDEPVTLDESGYKTDPAVTLLSWNSEDRQIIFNFEESLTPGKMYKLRSDVQDSSGNTLSFIIRFYGWNPRLPDLLINEFNPEGSGNNPDSIELIARSNGNTAGATIFLGTSNHFTESFVLPSLDVHEGDYIIIHMRPEGLSGEVSELTDKTISTGKLSSDEAWDIWVDGDKPISGKNGVISLYTNPFGKIMDTVVYSNRVSADSEDYLGWTATTIDMIEELSFSGEWINTDGFIRPEDAVSSDGTTGTRSICRSSLSADTDSPDDWHIVPTGERSFGRSNTDNVYVP